MSGHTPWVWVKYRKGNIDRGMLKDEICPGVDVTEHAESLAMFELHDREYPNDLWWSLVQVYTAEYKERLMKPFFGDEDLITELAAEK